MIQDFVELMGTIEEDDGAPARSYLHWWSVSTPGASSM